MPVLNLKFAISQSGLNPGYYLEEDGDKYEGNFYLKKSLQNHKL